MTFTTTTTHSDIPTSSFGRPAALAILAAAVATTTVAAMAHAAGVSLEIDGEPIPAAGFGTLTLVFAVLGLGLAAAIRRWARSPRRTFVRTTVALTALSLVPDLIVSASAATRLTLMATHVIAATIVIPVVAGRLARGRD